VPLVVNAKDFNEPSNFSIKTTTEAEMIESILLIISREKSTIVSSPPISCAINAVVAEAASNHAYRHIPLVPSAAKPERGITP